jgi:hypothetical protein
MALVACKECGAQVAESAPTCPRCGVSRPSGATGKLAIMRPSAITGAMHPVHVFVDGQVIGEVKNGDTLTLELPIGERRVEVRGHGGMSRSATIDIQQSKTITYRMYFSALGILGGGLNFKPA